MRRRRFLRNATFASGVVAASTAPYATLRLLAPESSIQISQHLRPPGALANDEEFIEACIGCGLCAEVCPPRCILFSKREGGDAVNTPYINPEQKACTLCGKCMEVCPTKALVKTPLNEIDMGIAQIDRAACYPWVDKGVCGACVAICPLGDKAISYDFANMYRPVVQKDCVGCGLCVEVCPEPSLPIRIVHRSDNSVASHRV
jgi:ferredoxin-type protein NapG